MARNSCSQVILGLFLTLTAGSAAGWARGASPAIEATIDSRLDARITLEVTSLPLREALKQLSAQSAVQLDAASEFGEQRVSFRFSNMPVRTVMHSLTGLLSHSPEKPRGYSWRRIKTDNPVRPTYWLWCTRTSREEESAHRLLPQQKLAATLSAFWGLARCEPAKRKRGSTPLPPNLFDPQVDQLTRAMAAVSPFDLQRLAQGLTVALDVRRLQNEALEWERVSRDHAERAAKLRADALRDGQPDPAPGYLQEAPKFAPTLRAFWEDEEGDKPARSDHLRLRRSGFPGNGERYTPIELYSLHEPSRFEELSEQQIDITTALSQPGVTRAQRSDPGFLLQAIARAAGLTMVQEEFYQPSRLGGLVREGFTVPKGSLREVVQFLCWQWHYRCQRVGDVWYFWPHNWSICRANDIPEPELAEWRKRLGDRPAFDVEARVEMARRYTQGQLSQTMRVALPQSGRWSATNTAALRLYGALSPVEKAEATTQNFYGAGIPLERILVGPNGTLVQKLLFQKDRELEAPPKQGLFLHTWRFADGLPSREAAENPYLVVSSAKRRWVVEPLGLLKPGHGGVGAGYEID